MTPVKHRFLRESTWSITDWLKLIVASDDSPGKLLISHILYWYIGDWLIISTRYITSFFSKYLVDSWPFQLSWFQLTLPHKNLQDTLANNAKSNATMANSRWPHQQNTVQVCFGLLHSSWLIANHFNYHDFSSRICRTHSQTRRWPIPGDHTSRIPCRYVLDYCIVDNWLMILIRRATAWR